MVGSADDSRSARASDALAAVASRERSRQASIQRCASSARDVAPSASSPPASARARSDVDDDVGALAKRRERRAAVEAGVARGATRGGAARASEDAMGQTRGRTRGGAARASEDAMGQTRGRRLDVDARGTGGSTRYRFTSPTLSPSHCNQTQTCGSTLVVEHRWPRAQPYSRCASSRRTRRSNPWDTIEPWTATGRSAWSSYPRPPAVRSRFPARKARAFGRS